MNTILNSSKIVDTYIDGLAASMGSAIAVTGRKVFMARNAMLMIHNPSAGVKGESKEFKKKAELLDKIKDQMISNVYQKKTGLSKAKLSRMMDEETWLNADEALELGFVDVIIDDVIKTSKKPKAILDDVQMTYEKYYKTNSTMNDIKLLEQLNKMLGLPENSSSQTAINELDEILDKYNSIEDDRINEMVNSALAQGKIDSAQKERYIRMAKSNFDDTKEILNDLTSKNPHHSISTMISEIRKSGKISIESNADDIPSNKTDWTLDHYRKYAPEELRNDSELYKKLIKIEFE